MPPHMSRPDSLFETGYTARDPCENSRGTLRFLPQLEMRPSSIAPNPVESQEAHPNSTVFLTSHRHPEKFREVTVTTREEPYASHHNSRQTMKFSPADVRRPFYTAVFPKKAHVSLGTQKGPPHALQNSRSFKRYPSQLERNAEFPATSQEETRFPRLNTR